MQVAGLQARARAPAVAHRQNSLLVALLIVFPVIGLEEFLHTTPVALATQPLYATFHWISDSLLALPLAVAAVGAGDWLARHYRIGVASLADVFTRACIVALLLALLLVPAPRCTTRPTG